jgi:putative spermidine/putrescine transport system permease protein
MSAVQNTAPMQMAAQVSQGTRQAERRGHFANIAFVSPSFLLVAALVLVPCCFWLFWLSAFDLEGNLSFENYLTVFASAGYRSVFLTTFLLAFATVLVTTLIGAPFALFLVRVQERKARWLLMAVMLPFWTSVLVRAYAWLVLLQRNGIINTLLIDLGVITEPLRLAFSFSATVVGMVHIMLPIFILPVYGVMSRIDADLMRAAASLGATRGQALRQVFLPLALPGIAAGGVMVFVMSLGFYVTPAILGGGRVQVIAMSIDRSLSNFTSYGAASALGVLLLVATGMTLGVAYLSVGKMFRSN